MIRFLSNGIRASNLGGPMPETIKATAMDSDWEERMKRIWRALKENAKMLKKRRHRLRRLPVWEDDEARWWRRRQRSFMENWPPNVRALSRMRRTRKKRLMRRRKRMKMLMRRKKRVKMWRWRKWSLTTVFRPRICIRRNWQKMRKGERWPSVTILGTRIPRSR